MAYQRLFTQGNDGPDSMRIDIPKDKVPRGNRRAKRRRTTSLRRSRRVDGSEPITKFIKEVLEQRSEIAVGGKA
jgi:hypothetical protein